jgi:hypothetical protein
MDAKLKAAMAQKMRTAARMIIGGLLLIVIFYYRAPKI